METFNRYSIYSALILYFCLKIALVQTRAVTVDQDDKTDLCGPREWHHFGIDKCFKFLDWKLIGGLKTHEEAKALCSQENPGSTLPSITSPEEQRFLHVLVGPTVIETDNIWLGGEIKNQTLLWDDRAVSNYSKIDFSGLNAGTATKQCLQVGTHRAPDEKWALTDCNAKNLVICQKPQTWAPSKIKSVLIETRRGISSSKGMFDRIEHFLQQFQGIQNELTESKRTVQDMNARILELEKLQADMNNSNDEIRKLDAKIESFGVNVSEIASAIWVAKNGAIPMRVTNSPSIPSLPSLLPRSSSTAIPVGFVYIQYGNQASPVQLWPSFDWEEITSAYAGLFFRAAGASAGAFGQRQEANAPRLTGVMYKDMEDHPGNVSIEPGQTSEAVRTGHWHSDLDKVGISFTMSGGEVRPVNSAFKMWKRRA